jgi:hypothetical protein
VDDVILNKEVNFLDAWDRVDPKPLESRLKPLVVCRRHLVHCLLFSAWAGERKAERNLSKAGSKPE